MNRVRRIAWSAGCVLWIAGLGAVLAGCGMPSAPLTPSLNLPAPVTDLAAVRAGKQVSLTWTMPKKNTDKLLLKGDFEVRVCRREGAGKACAAAGDLQLAPGVDGAFSETLAAPLATGEPRALTYFVELLNRRGRSAGLSNGAVVVAGQAPAPVTGLGAEVIKAGVVLHWTADAEEPAGMAIRLHRRLLTEQAGKPQQGPFAPPPEALEQNLLVETAGPGGRALDKEIRFGESYEYRAQRVDRITVDGQTMELDGAFSTPVRVDVQDIFPPAVPAGLAAVAVAGENGGAPSIDLSWQPDTETDLAGYIVYRREAGGEWLRISAAQPVIGPGFEDPHVEAGHSYGYAVSAVDRSGHESARSDEASETVPN